MTSKLTNHLTLTNLKLLNWCFLLVLPLGLNTNFVRAYLLADFSLVKVFLDKNFFPFRIPAILNFTMFNITRFTGLYSLRKIGE